MNSTFYVTHCNRNGLTKLLSGSVFSRSYSSVSKNDISGKGWSSISYRHPSNSSGQILAVEKLWPSSSQRISNKTKNSNENQFRDSSKSPTSLFSNKNNEISSLRKKFFFAHDVGHCRQVWYSIVEQMQKIGLDFNESILWDIRGHGDSVADPNSIEAKSWWALANDVIEIVNMEDKLEEEEQQRATTQLRKVSRIGVGHGLGATILAMAENIMPGTFSHLILIEPLIFPGPSRITDSNIYLAARAEKKMSTFNSLEQIYSYHKQKFPAWDQVSLNYAIQGLYQQYSNGQFKLKCDPKFESKLLMMSNSHSLWDQLPDIHCPTLIVSGEHSTHYPSSDLPARMSSRFQRGRHHVVNGGSHDVHLDKPLQVAHLINETVGRMSSFEKLIAEGQM